MFNKKFVAIVMMAGLTAAGCSSVRVVKNPDEGDPGVRYYRPKPYLLVTPADPTGRMVNLKLEYLPDYAEEYSVHVRGKAAVSLKDGWNLVALTTKGSPPPPPPPKDEPAPPPPAPAPPVLPQAVVAATNVPMGYYESVYELIGPTKYFKGWKYIGFTVLGPTRPGICRKPDYSAANGGGGGGHGHGHGGNGGNGNGFANVPGECFTGPLYGMVFFNGVMTFRQVEEIANNQLCPTFVNPAPGYVAPQTVTEERKTTVDEIKQKRSEGTLEEVPATTPAPAQPPAALDATPPPAPPAPATAPPTPAPSTPGPAANNARKPKARTAASVVLDLPPLPPGFDR